MQSDLQFRIALCNPVSCSNLTKLLKITHDLSHLYCWENEYGAWNSWDTLRGRKTRALHPLFWIWNKAVSWNFEVGKVNRQQKTNTIKRRVEGDLRARSSWTGPESWHFQPLHLCFIFNCVHSWWLCFMKNNSKSHITCTTTIKIVIFIISITESQGSLSQCEFDTYKLVQGWITLSNVNETWDLIKILFERWRLFFYPSVQSKRSFSQSRLFERWNGSSEVRNSEAIFEEYHSSQNQAVLEVFLQGNLDFEQSNSFL